MQGILTFDADGRLRIAGAILTKVGIARYAGHELLRDCGRALGIDPRKTYELLRPVDEVQRAAATFGGLPILTRHQRVSAGAHRPDLTIGVVGDAHFEFPNLVADVVFWTRGATDSVEAGYELSPAYTFDLDVRAGVYEGRRYDGVMRNLVGNHVALVERTRASMPAATMRAA